MLRTPLEIPAADSKSGQELRDQDAWVRRLAHRLVRDSNEAVDLAQEAWLAALDQPSPSAVTCAWLGQVLRNVARRSYEDRAPIPDATPAPDLQRLLAERK